MDLDIDTWCPVCDRLIVQPLPTSPKAPRKASTGDEVPQFIQPVAPKLGRGKSGTIRLKAAAAVAAANATGNPAPRTALRRNTSTAKVQGLKMQSFAKTEEKRVPIEIEKPTKPAWTSTLYCSPECAAVDGQQTSAMFEEVARSLSLTHGSREGLSALDPIRTRGFSIESKDQGPASPLFISGSDTESSATSASCGQRAMNHHGGTSVPRAFEYFKEIKDDADDAWRQRERERRRSLHNGAQAPSARPFLPPMIRQASTQSHASHRTFSDASSDSLSSLWQQEEGMPVLARTPSGPGLLRGMTLLQRVVTTSEKISMDEKNGARRPSMGHCTRSKSQGNGTLPTLASIRAAATAIPSKAALPRSNLSNTSLVASSPAEQGSLAQGALSAEFGSHKSATLELYNAYANAFPHRDLSGSSSSLRSSSLAFPTYAPCASAERQPRAQIGFNPNGSATIRVKSRTTSLAAWDSFGREEVEADKRKCNKRRESHTEVARSVPAGFHSARNHHESEGESDRMTPTPSLRMEQGRWTVAPSQTARKGRRASRGGSSSSGASERSSSTGPAPSNAGGLSIPERAPRPHDSIDASSMSTNGTSRPAPGSYLCRASHISPPSLDGLHITQHERPASAPRPFNWDEHERRGGKTYALPDGLMNRHRASATAATGHGGSGRLFYFQ